MTQELKMSKSDIVQLKADANKNAALAASQDGLRKRLRKTTADSNDDGDPVSVSARDFDDALHRHITFVGSKITVNVDDVYRLVLAELDPMITEYASGYTPAYILKMVK